MEESRNNQNNFWMMFVTFGLLMSIIGYLVGSVKPFGSIAQNYNQLTEQKVANNTTHSNKTTDQNSAQNTKTNPTVTNPPSPTLNPVNVDANTSNENSEGELSTTDHVDGYHKSFDITYPDSWNLTTENTAFSTDVIISKGNFKIEFRQADVGSSRCVYTDEADYGVDLNYPNSKYKNYTQFSSKDENFRRTQWAEQDNYSLCSKNKNGANEYGLYTQVGFINYEVPNNHTKKDLEEMDQIITSIVIK